MTEPVFKNKAEQERMLLYSHIKDQKTMTKELAEKTQKTLLEIVEWSNDLNRKTALEVINTLSCELLEDVSEFLRLQRQ